MNLKKNGIQSVPEHALSTHLHITYNQSYNSLFYTLIENVIIHLLWDQGYFVLIVILHIIMSALF